MKDEKKHVLGCDEYHAHRAPECCDFGCWCRALPKVEWEGTVSIKYIVEAQIESEAYRKIYEMVRNDLERGIGFTLRKKKE